MNLSIELIAAKIIKRWTTGHLKPSNRKTQSHYEVVILGKKIRPEFNQASESIYQSTYKKY